MNNLDEIEIEEKPEMGYASIEVDVVSLLQKSMCIPCTFELCIPLRTYDAMLASSIQRLEKTRWVMENHA